jgi:hypothetical protein
MSIFVLTMSDHVLHAFADAAAALNSAVVKQSDGESLLFFADNGDGLRHEAAADANYLRPWASCSACTLRQVLHMIDAVEGAAPLNSLSAIAKHLEST